ncbi:hypothetical protein [Actinomadura madurae]|uniref:hypothetical protein n=1 Tax=Actinomadura madurae TaxID=1993 RepID=UPI0020D2498C|nr:hypothetical protein [Actinomadura madurae]MCP9982767.1 hypothetical protein [Actinomadura madurae]
MRLIGYKSDGVRHIGRLDGESVEPLATTADFYAKPDVALRQAGGTDRLPWRSWRWCRSSRRPPGCSAWASTTSRTATRPNGRAGSTCRSTP